MFRQHYSSLPLDTLTFDHCQNKDELVLQVASAVPSAVKVVTNSSKRILKNQEDTFARYF